MAFQHLFMLLLASRQNVVASSLGAHVWFAQNNSKGGKFHLPTNISMDKMYHSP